MNERIREFEKQCWSHYIDGVLVDGHLHFDVNKFAQLIVKECAQCCLDDGLPDKSPMHQASISYANNIKRHFGISNLQQFSDSVKQAFKDGADLSNQDTP